MSILNQASKPDDGPIIATITGDAGVGKTSLCATFPKPIFIRAEDGMQSIDRDIRPDALPVINKVDDLWEQLNALARDEHDYQTLVIDSVTQLETLFGDHVMQSDPKKPKSLAQANGGYGAGFGAVAALHGRVRKAAKVLKEKRGMNVVFIAHSDVTTLELPDEDPYSRYELRLHKKSMAHYVDNVDLVAYLKLETFTTGDGDRKKAISSGNRIAVCYTSAAQVSKNRFGIIEDIDVPHRVNPFLEFIPVLKQQQASKTQTK
ncbi:Sak4-like ssDNA annealing protein [Idiomarinaceae phage Phi1M2-2]|uniref:Sak4-like ssDNA annealing protein n=1 Tax=Idiomarinaceae phage Phi1M2-2 TaxID=1527515 RepID=UPI0004F6083C|nr:Sak4-like ssDNA annealing protein [Idiomarinaceae phage Phi1M2-2]AIM40819.1 putative RecA-like NTPase [Idiomarinaceae phage Phi1M2-2]